MTLRLRAVAVMGGCSLALSSPSIAIAAAGDIVVHVVDAATSQPVRAARITLLGTGPGEARNASAGESGSVTLNGMAPGAIAIIVEAPGYPEYRSAFDLPERSTTPLSVIVKLGSGLAHIGRTAARPSVSTAQRTVGENSPVRRISADLIDALSKLGGVAGSGLDPLANRISLGGRDPSQTSYTLNGTPVGVNAAQLAIDSDLLQEAQVDSARDTIGFSLLAPTVDPVHKLETSLGGYGSSLVRVSAQGTSGTVGYAFAHVERGANSSLNGRVYKDLSGETYRHVGALVKLGDYAKLALPVGNWSLSASDSVSRSASMPLPAYFAGPLPAGIGPGETKTSNAENALVVANGTVHGVATSFDASSWSYRGFDDQLMRIVAGQSSPLAVADASWGRSVQAYVSIGLSDTRSLEALGTLTWTGTSSGFLLPPFTTAASATAFQREIRLTARRRLDEGRSYRLIAGATSDAGGLLPVIGVDESLHRGNADRSLSLSYTRKPIRADTPENVRALYDPQTSTYDCHARTATAAVPGDAAAQPAILAANGSLAVQGRRGHFQVSGYLERQRNVLLTAATTRADSAVGDAALAAFVAQLLAGYGTFGGCSGSIVPADVLLVRNVAGVSVQYAGLQLGGSYTVSRKLLLDADVALQSARPTALPAGLAAPQSYYGVGRQLPNVPYWNGTATLDWQLGDTRTEALVNATFTSSNNARNLPAALVWSVGTAHAFSPHLNGTVIGTNVFGAYPGDFVSARYAVPYRLANGRLRPALAAPEAPPRIFVTLSYRSR